jgi:two-component system sensor histidine kinase PilS (NtrC family)
MPSSLFNYFNVYRVTIAILLMAVTFSQKFMVAEFRAPATFQLIASLYLAFNIICLLAYRYQFKADTRQVFASALFDLAFLHALFYCSEGITGGLSNLLIITVAAANIMLRGAKAYSLAAFASLLSLGLELERYSVSLSNISDLARAGLMGAIYFAAAFIVQNLSRRISQSESLAVEQQQNIVELQALNHQIIQSMRTGIIVCDENFDVKVLNQACTDLLGLDSEQALPLQLVRRIQLWQEMPSIRTKPFQVSADLPLVQANFSSMDKEDIRRTLVFIEDTRLLTQQAQQLKLASLGRLTASIAHEVRNPLGAISHATQLLVESDDLHPADRKMTDIIQRHCARMNGIIENTLTLSRRGKPEIQELELQPWIAKVLGHYRVHEEKFKRLKLSVANSGSKARFDPSQIEQVLTNLIDNALFHGAKVSPDSNVELRLDVNEKTGQAFIEISDDGPGVSKDDEKHLFEPFFTTEPSGTGLGLYLSRELCEANQANLSYIAREGQGACFKLVFAHYKRIV